MGKFKDFLLEMPTINNFAMEFDDFDAWGTTPFSKLNHSTSTKLTDTVAVNHHSDGDRFYYRHENGVPTAVSQISDNEMEHVGEIKQQQGLMKKTTTPSKHVDELFSEVLKHEGEIHSDTQQTDGSKNFWKNIHSRIPNVEVKHHDLENGESKIADSDYLKKNEDKIWGSRASNDRHILSAKFKE